MGAGCLHAAPDSRSSSEGGSQDLVTNGIRLQFKNTPSTPLTNLVSSKPYHTRSTGTSSGAIAILARRTTQQTREAEGDVAIPRPATR